MKRAPAGSVFPAEAPVTEERRLVRMEADARVCCAPSVAELLRARSSGRRAALLGLHSCPDDAMNNARLIPPTVNCRASTSAQRCRLRGSNRSPLLAICERDVRQCAAVPLEFLVNLRQRIFARRFLPNAPHHHSPNAPPQEQSRRNGRRLGGGIQLTKSVLNSVHANRGCVVHIGAVWRSHNSFSFDACPYIEQVYAAHISGKNAARQPEPPPRADLICARRKSGFSIRCNFMVRASTIERNSENS